MKINLGCGESPLDGYINIDSIKNKLTRPDVIANIKLEFLPFKSYECEEICALHVLEHIERDYWSRIFDEFYRLLIPDGVLILAYPEFERCAHNFITNFKGARDFWRMTLYGRQDYPGDYHVVPMRTAEVVNYLTSFGFYDIKYTSEVDEEWSTFLTCKKGKKPITRPELYRQELFGLT